MNLEILKNRSNKILILAIAIIFLLLIQLLIGSFVNAENSNNTKAIFINNQQITNKEILVNIKINPQGNLINASGIYLNFSTSTMQAKSIKLNNDFCQFIISEKIDNELGQIEILCGTANPVNTETNIAEIIFEKINNKDFAISIDNEKSQILAHDGIGTNIFINE